MSNFYHMSDAELEVMEKLWDQGSSIKQSQLLALFEEDGKEWKRQTLNTFLSRLEEKGLVKRENRMVEPVYSREQYNFMQMQEAINHMYGGKISNFVAAFTKENGIDQKEAEELIKILENTSEKAMKYLIVMSLSGSVMVGIYMLLRCVTRNTVSVRLQYILAKAAVLYYLIPLPFIKKWYDEIAIRIHPVGTEEILRVSPKWNYYAVQINEKLYYNSYTKIHAAVISVWLLIALIMLLHELFDYLKTRRMLTYCMSKTRIEEDDSFKNLKEQIGLKRRIVVYQGENEEKTMTFGFLRPAILCGHKVGSKEAELILRHELIHIKRWDTVWKILQRFVLFLHLWNPVAWILYFDFERTCEWSCDEEAVSGKTKEEAKEYVRLLIHESSKKKDEGKSRLRLGVGFGNGAKKLKKRMDNIMMMKKWNKIAAGVITVGLVLVNSLTAFAYPDVVHRENKNYISQDELDDAMGIDEWVYIPDEAGSEQFTDIANYGTGNDIDILYDIQFIDAEGNVYPVQDENSTNSYASCTHTYSTGVVNDHKKNATGGCTVVSYSAKRCTKCGLVVTEALISETKYTVCTH